MTWLVKATTAFKREYKLMQKRGADMQLLQDIVTKFAKNEF
jgi:mRNA-degrading endonuclease YafQ of YafQ-DinJ toxin-antitoxin module